MMEFVNGRTTRVIYLILLVSIFPSVVLAQEIHWLRDFNEAKPEAYQTGKLMLLYFEVTSKEASFKMNHEVWNQPAVINLAKKFVCLKINFEQWAIFREQYDRLALLCRVNLLPTSCIMDPVGNILFRGEEFIRANEMKEVMQPLPTNLTGVYNVLKQLEGDPENTLLKIAVGDAYYEYKVPEISNNYYEDVLDADTLKINRKLAEHVDTYRALNYQMLGELTKSINMFERILDIYPNSENQPMHLYTLAKFYTQALNEIKAEVYVSILKKKYPNSEYLKMAEQLKK